MNSKKEKPRLIIIVVVLLLTILFGWCLSSLVDDFVYYKKTIKKPYVSVIKRIDEKCFDVEESDTDYGTTIVTKCSAKLKYKVNGKTYTTKRTEDVEDIPDKVYYDSNNPSKYYLIYESKLDLYVSVIFITLIFTLCLFFLFSLSYNYISN